MTETDYLGYTLARGDTLSFNSANGSWVTASDCPYGCAYDHGRVTPDGDFYCGEALQCTYPTTETNAQGETITRDSTSVVYHSYADDGTVISNSYIAASDCPYGCALWFGESGDCGLHHYDCDVAGKHRTIVETNLSGNTIVRDDTHVMEADMKEISTGQTYFDLSKMIAASDCPYGCANWDNNLGRGFCAFNLYDCDVAGSMNTTAQTATCDVYIIPGDGTYMCGSISNCPFACTVDGSDSNIQTYQICGT